MKEAEPREVNMSEIWTIDRLAQFLQMSRAQAYNLTRARARARMKNPVPVLRINGNIRFSRAAIEAWLQRIAKESQ
jgi:predicted DNA-binding transcriptional regulator AlpA